MTGNMLEPQESTATLEPLLSTDDVARYLGVPIATLYQWKHKGSGPRSLRVGKHLRYRRDDVENWLRLEASSP
jgi:excisionase family DNA binding protein